MADNEKYGRIHQDACNWVCFQVNEYINNDLILFEHCYHTGNFT